MCCESVSGVYCVGSVRSVFVVCVVYKCVCMVFVFGVCVCV